MPHMNSDHSQPAAGPQALVAIDGVEQYYGANQVLAGISFAVRRGEISCLLGASGCGKTTVLRCIAGFEPVAAGEIRLNGALVSSKNFSVPTEQRRRQVPARIVRRTAAARCARARAGAKAGTFAA